MKKEGKDLTEKSGELIKELLLFQECRTLKLTLEFLYPSLMSPLSCLSMFDLLYQFAIAIDSRSE
jgi:hypothetical protein